MNDKPNRSLVDKPRDVYWFWAILALAYVGAVVGVGIAVYVRSQPETPVATRNLQRNRPIAPGDLETAGIQAMQGRFLTVQRLRGEPVRRDQLSAERVSPTVPTTMAAVVTIKAADRQSLAIDPGGMVQVCLPGMVVTPPTEVLVVNCDQHFCSVLLELSEVPPQLYGSEALKGAWLGNALRPCMAGGGR